MDVLSGTHHSQMLIDAYFSHTDALTEEELGPFYDAQEGSIISVPQQPLTHLRKAYEDTKMPTSSVNILGFAAAAGGSAFAATYNSLGLPSSALAAATASALIALIAPYHQAKSNLKTLAKTHRDFEYHQFQYTEHLRLLAIKMAAENLVRSADCNIDNKRQLGWDTLGKLVRFDSHILESACDKLQITVLQIRHALDSQAGILAVDGPDTYVTLGLDPHHPEHEKLLLAKLQKNEHNKSWDMRASETDHAEKSIKSYGRLEYYDAPVLPQARLLSLRRNFQLVSAKTYQNMMPALSNPCHEIVIEPFHSITDLQSRIAAFEEAVIPLDLPALR